MEFRKREGISFEEAERRYAELARLYEAGQITEEEFNAERQRLLVLDDEGKWWAKSRQTGQWLYHDGSAWIVATPPAFYRPASSESSPQRTEWDLPGQPKQGSVTRSGRPTTLWVGLGVALVLVVIALIVGVARLSPTGEIADDSKPTNEKKEEMKDEKPKTKIEPKAVADGSNGSSQEELRAAVEDYYEAVDRQDWNYTYDNLDSETKQEYTRDEYIRKNQYLASVDPLAQSSPVITSEVSRSSPVEVTLNQTFESGVTSSRVTYFVREDGAWKHRFSQQDDAIFLPDASYDEFVAAKKSGV